MGRISGLEVFLCRYLLAQVCEKDLLAMYKNIRGSTPIMEGPVEKTVDTDL